jgi:hypothetical protein
VTWQRALGYLACTERLTEERSVSQDEAPRNDPEGSRVIHFSWTDGLIVVGAVIILPVAILQRNWFFLGISVAMLGAVGARVAFTRWLAKRQR